MDRRLGEPQSRSGRGGRNKIKLSSPAFVVDIPIPDFIKIIPVI
jgi:hypothetical protein